MPAPATTPAEPLKVGVNHERVGHLQNRLAALGHGVRADGTFGPKTHAAVTAFQQANGLNADGIVGPATTEALRKGDQLKQQRHDQEEAEKAQGGAAKPAAKPAAAGSPKPAAKPAAGASDQASKRFARKIEIDHTGRVRVYYRNETGTPNADAAAPAGALAEASDGVTNFKAVAPEAKKRIGPIVRHYMKMAHPFTTCVADNTKRFGKDRAERICAVVKDLGKGTTHWRKGNKKTLDEAVDAAVAALVEAGIETLEHLEIVEAYLLGELGRDVVWLDEARPETHRRVLEEAAARGRGRRGVKGDADGDGIPFEAKRKPKGKAKPAKVEASALKAGDRLRATANATSSSNLRIMAGSKLEVVNADRGSFDVKDHFNGQVHRGMTAPELNNGPFVMDSDGDGVPDAVKLTDPATGKAVEITKATDGAYKVKYGSGEATPHTVNQLADRFGSALDFSKIKALKPAAR